MFHTSEKNLKSKLICIETDEKLWNCIWYWKWNFAGVYWGHPKSPGVTQDHPVSPWRNLGGHMGVIWGSPWVTQESKGAAKVSPWVTQGLPWVTQGSNSVTLVILGYPGVILSHPGVTWVTLCYPGFTLGHQGVILGHPRVILHPYIRLHTSNRKNSRKKQNPTNMARVNQF